MKEQKTIVPPIKCQGIKTKIVPFIREHVRLDRDRFWIEPFVGTGAVAFNIAHPNAILSDKNPYIIDFYKGVQNGTITPEIVRAFLELHGARLSEGGAGYYKEIRDAFNKNKDPLYFLFLDRAAFNGMIRFNSKGEFNVPFCHKPDRFSKAYITKICNQVRNTAEVMEGKNWQFVCCPWKETMLMAEKGDYIYLDPPYIGRNTKYVGEWSEAEAVELAKYAKQTPANVCLSMWKEDAFRRNSHLFEYWSDFSWFDIEHFYHVGAKEGNRHSIVEVLAIKNV